MMKTIAIIGGGASGIIAAIRLASSVKNARILLLEKNERIGKKLLATGNGKCNISNETVNAHSYDSAFAAGVMEQYDYALTEAYFRSLGLFWKSDAAGRCYPLSESANNVLNILLRALKQANVEILTDFQVNGIKKQNGSFIINGTRRLQADSVIMAIGSAAGVKGYNGYDLLHNLGIDYPRPVPALCPIPSEESFLKSLKGVRAKGTLTLGTHTQRGEIQFTENAVSGICAFNLAKHASNGDILHIDFTNRAFSRAQLEQILTAGAAAAAENAQLLDFLLPRKLAFVVLKQAALKPSESPKMLSNSQISVLINHLTDFQLRLLKPTQMKSAQCVCGGLNAAQVNPETLESKQYKGLFFSGELLDADGPCGGYNLQWAWSSGLCAADHVIQYLEKTID